MMTSYKSTGRKSASWTKVMSVYFKAISDLLLRIKGTY